jgi:hypothetical protein
MPAPVESRSSFTMPAVMFAIVAVPYLIVIPGPSAARNPESIITDLEYRARIQKPH